MSMTWPRASARCCRGRARAIRKWPRFSVRNCGQTKTWAEHRFEEKLIRLGRRFSPRKRTERNTSAEFPQEVVPAGNMLRVDTTFDGPEQRRNAGAQKRPESVASWLWRAPATKGFAINPARKPPSLSIFRAVHPACTRCARVLFSPTTKSPPRRRDAAGEPIREWCWLSRYQAVLASAALAKV